MTAPVYKVLAADDDPTVALLMPLALPAGSFSVTMVDNGNEALAEFLRADYDLVLLDVEMPGLDGFEVCAAIRRSHRARVLVVLVSGHSSPALLARAAELGATYLTKPVDWQALGARLEALLEARLKALFEASGDQPSPA